MANGERTRVPAWFWAVAAIAFLWEAAGCFAYLQQSRAAEEMPVWAWSGFAVAAWGGLAAAILLLLRLRVARLAFALSLAGVAVQLAWTLFGRPAAAAAGEPGGAGAFLMFVLLAAGVLLWFSDLAARRGWLR